MRRTRVPLAWRTITHDKRRFALSIAGILFASVLMFMQLGFLNAVFDSQVELLRRLNADLFVTNSSKHHLGSFEPFSRRRVEQARTVAGVAAAYPLYIEGKTSFWQNPETHELRLIRVIGVSPSDPVFKDLPPDPRLDVQDTVLIDEQSKPFYGPRRAGVRTELAGRKVNVVGVFDLGTDFDYNGTVMMSEANFLKFFPGQETANAIARVELGLIRLSPGADARAVQAALQHQLPEDVRVWTKDQLIAQEVYFWQAFTPIGFIFGIGLGVGFVVGFVICSQILYTSVVDRMPLFGTLKAIGYTNRYLIKLVLREALLLAMLGFIPSIAIAAALYRKLASLIGFEMFLNTQRILLVMACTAGMSTGAALIAIRKAVLADPAEVFK